MSVISQCCPEKKNQINDLDYLLNSDIEISAEQINLWISEQTKFFTEATDYEYYLLDEAANVSDSKLRELGIDVNVVKSAGNDIVSILKTKGLNKESKKQIHNVISDLFSKAALHLEPKIKQNTDDKKFDKNKVTSSIKLLLWVILVNSLSTIVNTLLFGPWMGQVITSVVVAPITEESAKAISIRGNFRDEFFVVFNAYEMTSYVTRLTSSGMSILKAIGLRIIPVTMHGFTTIIQKIFNSDKVKQHFKGNDKDQSDKAATCGFLTGVLIHSSYNSIAFAIDKLITR